MIIVGLFIAAAAIAVGAVSVAMVVVRVVAVIWYVAPTNGLPPASARRIARAEKRNRADLSAVRTRPLVFSPVPVSSLTPRLPSPRARRRAGAGDLSEGES